MSRAVPSARSWPGCWTTWPPARTRRVPASCLSLHGCRPWPAVWPVSTGSRLRWIPPPTCTRPSSRRRKDGSWVNTTHLPGCADAPNSSTRWPCQQGADHRAYRRAGSPTRNFCPLLISRRRLSSRSGRLSETLFTDPRYMSPCSKRQSKPYTEKGRFAPAIR